jgi:hypothetical protein
MTITWFTMPGTRRRPSDRSILRLTMMLVKIAKAVDTRATPAMMRTMGAAEEELLHGAQSDAQDAADDHVPVHAVGLHAIHAHMLPSSSAVEVAAALNIRALDSVG